MSRSPHDALAEAQALMANEHVSWPGTAVRLLAIIERLAALRAGSGDSEPDVQAVIAAARAENEEAHHGEVTERTRAILNNALLDYDAAFAARSGSTETSE